MLKLDDFSLLRAQILSVLRGKKVVLLDWEHWYQASLDIDRYGARHLLLMVNEPLSDRVLQRLDKVISGPLQRGYTEGEALLDELEPFELKFQMFTIWTNFGGIEQVREEKPNVNPKAQ